MINPHHPAPATQTDYDARAGNIRLYLKFNPAEAVPGLANASLARLRYDCFTFETGLGWLYRNGSVRPLVPGAPVPELGGPKS